MEEIMYTLLFKYEAVLEYDFWQDASLWMM